jgi:hypothetical protein
MKTWHKWIVAIVVAVCALMALPKLAVFVVSRAFAAMVPKVGDVVFSDFARARMDATTLIARAQAEHATQETPIYLSRADLPPSLRLKRLVSGFAYPDHLSLVMHSNPEFLVGARFWAEGVQVPAGDKPTPYSGVTFFYVDKNAVKEGDNRL